MNTAWVFGCPSLLYNRHMTLNFVFNLTRVMRNFVQLYLFHTLTFAHDGGTGLPDVLFIILSFFIGP